MVDLSVDYSVDLLNSEKTISKAQLARILGKKNQLVDVGIKQAHSPINRKNIKGYLKDG